jgi:hypothetical protein
MIVFELICPDHHRFEGWFASSGDFESQKARGMLTCPACGNSEINKLPTAKIAKSDSASADGGSRNASATPSTPPQSPAMPTAQQIHKVIDYFLANSENVGKNFAEEARRIHREEAPARSIRGVASREETEELLDEGIPIMPLPVPPQGDWH